MTAETATSEQKTAPPEPNVLWCNFCDFRTTDQKVYLAHSCTKELERSGVTIEATGKNECS